MTERSHRASAALALPAAQAGPGFDPWVQLRSRPCVGEFAAVARLVTRSVSSSPVRAIGHVHEDSETSKPQCGHALLGRRASNESTHLAASGGAQRGQRRRGRCAQARSGLLARAGALARSAQALRARAECQFAIESRIRSALIVQGRLRLPSRCFDNVYALQTAVTGRNTEHARSRRPPAGHNDGMRTVQACLGARACALLRCGTVLSACVSRRQDASAPLPTSHRSAPSSGWVQRYPERRGSVVQGGGCDARVPGAH